MKINCNFFNILHRQIKSNDVDDANGCGSGECGDGQPFLVAAERFALVGRRRFSRAAAAAESVGASCGTAAVASCSGMEDAGARPDAGDSAALECGEICGWRRCR